MLTANYSAMILEPRIRVLPKHEARTTFVYAASSQYGKFSYKQMMDLAIKGKIPKLSGTYTFSESWCQDFCDAVRSMTPQVRRVLYNLDKGDFEKTLKTAIAIIKHERTEFALCFYDGNCWKCRPVKNALQVSAIEYAKVLAHASKDDCRVYVKSGDKYEPLCKVSPNGTAKYDAETLKFLAEVMQGSMGVTTL